MIFVNFKTYKQGTGVEAILLEKILAEISFLAGVKIVPVVQAADVKEAVQNSKLEIWTQHVDPVEYGAHTGYIIPEAVAQDGARGTFLNHSEHKFANFTDLSKAVQRAKQARLETLIFASDLKELESVIILSPDYVAYEPPELVGSSTSSVATEKPEVIFQASEVAKRAGKKLIVGAGIKSKEDIKRSLELGAYGFAIASSIVTAKDPKTELLSLLEGYKQQ
jgi:triosephosphate isomerase (TIM)